MVLARWWGEGECRTLNVERGKWGEGGEGEGECRMWNVERGRWGEGREGECGMLNVKRSTFHTPEVGYTFHVQRSTFYNPPAGYTFHFQRSTFYFLKCPPTLS